MIGGRHPEHLCGHDRGQRIGEAGHYFKAAPASQSVDESLGDLTDVLTKHGDAAGREGRRRQAADAAVLWRIEEQHLSHHQRRDWAQLAHTERLQSLRCGRPGGPVVVKHTDHVRVLRDYPRVQVGIPVNGVFLTQPAVQRIRIGQYLRVEEVKEAKGGSPLLYRLAARHVVTSPSTTPAAI